MAGGEWEGLVVVCGASWWDGTPLLERHLAVELTRYAPVLYVDPPTSFLTRFRNADAAEHAARPGLRQVSDRLCVLSVRVPPLLERPMVKQVAVAAVRRSIRRTVRALGCKQVQALVVPTLEPLFGCAGERVSVLYVKDDYLAGARLTGVPPRRLSRLMTELPGQADLVAAVSDVLVERLRAMGVESLHIPNGVDVDVFAGAGPPPDPDVRPVVAFIGHLSDRVDVELLRAVADRGLRLRMIGPPQETMTAGHLSVLRGRPNVEWAGRIPYGRLGAALSDVTTCLLPYGDSEFNRSSFPLKILEYLAAGRRVVSTDLPAVRWLNTPLVEMATGPEEFAQAVVSSTATPLGQDEIDRRRTFARAHSWSARARILAEHLGVAEPQGVGGSPGIGGPQHDRWALR